MGFNLLMLCIGLIICFGGIYIKKVVSGLLGLLWGAVLGLIIAVVAAISAGSLWYLFEEDSTLIWVIVCALVLCVLSAFLDRLCAAINAFMSSFVILLLLAAVLAEDMESIGVLLVVLALASVVIAVFAYIYYTYAFIIVTAFSGAFIATLAGIGLFADRSFAEVMEKFFMYADGGDLLLVYGITIVLGGCGFYVQLQRLKKNNNKGPGNSSSANIQSGNFDTMRSASADKINDVAHKVNTEAKKVGNKVNKVAAPILEDMGAQLKSSWCDLTTESGRQDLKASILECKFLFIPLLVNVFIPPLMYYIGNKIPYFSFYYMVVYWISLISGVMAIGVLTYLVLTKDIKLNMVYQIPYLFGYFVFDLRYHNYDPLFSIIVLALKYLIIWTVAYALSKLIKKESVKPLVISIVSFFLDQYVVSWIAYGYWGFYVGLRTIFMLAVEIATVWLLFKMRHNINIFSLREDQSGHNAGASKCGASAPARLRRCPKCQVYYADLSCYCANCGTTLEVVCPHCGYTVKDTDRFCQHCGKTV